MSPAIHSWTLKKLLQRYLGEFLSKEVSLDQLSMELSEGSAQLSDLDMNTRSINENLRKLSFPLELVDGYAGLAKIDIPWLKLVNDPTKVTVEDLQLTFQKATCATYSSILQAFSSEDLAESVLEAIFDQGPSRSNDVTEFFTKLVKSVFSRFCVEFRRVTCRFEMDDNDSDLATALELRINKVMFTYEKSESPEFQKKFEIEGISLYTDIFSRSPMSSDPLTSEFKDSESHHHPMTLDTFTAFETCRETMTPEEAPEAQEPLGTPMLSDPIKMLEITGPVKCLFKTTYKSDNDKKTLTSIDIKISIDTSIDFFASFTQLEIVRKSIDSLIPLSVARGRPMTDNDFEVMSQSIKESSFTSVRSHHEESQLITLSVEALSLNFCVPLIDPLSHVDSESLGALKQDSEAFFTDKTSYHKDHFLISSESINLKIEKSSESLEIDVSSGAFKVDGLGSKLLEVLSVDLNLLSVDEEVITIDMKLGAFKSDLDVQKILELKNLEMKPFFKEEPRPTTLGPLKFHVTCPSYLTTFKFGSEEQVELSFKELAVDIDNDPDNLLISASLSEARGSYHLQDVVHVTKASLTLVKGPRGPEEEEAVDLDDLLETSFSNFQKVPGPFSQVPKTYNAENGDVVELLPPGTRKEMLQFHEESKTGHQNQMKVEIQAIQIHVPEKSELEKFYKWTKDLKTSSESESSRDPYSIGIEVADSVILLNTMNHHTGTPSQLSLRLQNLHFGSDSEYLHLTSSGVQIGFCEERLIPSNLGESDFGAVSKSQIQMSRRQKCTEDVLAVAIGTPGSLQKVVSVALRNSRIQARPVGFNEDFWGVQLMELFGFLEPSGASSEAQDIQFSLENVQLDYEHGWVHPESGAKLAGLLERGTVIRRSSKKTSPLLVLLDNVKLHLLHPTIAHAQIVEVSSVQLEHFPKTATIRCFTDVLKATMTSDELAIFFNVLNEFRMSQFPREEPSESKNPPEDVEEKQARIEEMIRDAINEEAPEYHRQELYVVDDEKSRSAEVLEEPEESEPDPIFQLHLVIATCQGSLLNRGTSESVILSLERVKILPKVYESSKKSLNVEIANFCVKDRLSSSDIDALAYPMNGQKASFDVRLNKDATGVLAVSLPDIKMNLDQDTVEFVEKYLEQFGARWTLLTIGGDCLATGEDGFVVIDPSGFGSQYLQKEKTPTYFTHFKFSPEVRISIDYQGKSKTSNLSALFQGLIQLQGIPITLEKIDTRRGILGVPRLLEYAIDHWRAAKGLETNMSTVVSSFTPIRPIVKGIVELISHPIAEMQKEKNGSLMRGIGRGVGAFGVSSATGVIGMAQTVTGAVQCIAEYGVGNPPPAKTTHRHRKTSPSLLPSIVSMTQATQNLLGGLRGHICPEQVRDEKRKYGTDRKK